MENIFAFTAEERSEWAPDIGFDNSDATLPIDAAEERINALLTAWGWTEESRDEAHPADWQDAVDLAYQAAINSPAGTPTEIFTMIMEARGWPRSPWGTEA